MAIVFNLTFNARDPLPLARFWAAALDYRVVEETSDLVRLRSRTGGATPDLLVLRSDEPATSTSRLHLDLAATNVSHETARLVALGATLVDGGTPAVPNEREANGIRWLVMSDPAGNEFCLGALPDTGP